MLAAGAALLVPARVVPAAVVYAATALVGVGYAGAQLFPISMLADTAAVDASRSGGNRAGVFTGVWTAGETLGLALGPGVFGLVLALGGYASSTDGAVTQPASALTAIVVGFSVLLHRTHELRRPQFFASAAWPGYTMLNSTTQSTKSGGPLAAAWAVLHTVGDEGYVRLTAEVLDGMDRLLAGLHELPALHVVAPPDSTLVALVTDGSCDVFTIADEVAAAGWYVQPQLTHAGQPPTLHLTLSAATAPHVEEFLVVLARAVETARAAGPVGVDPEVAAFVAALDPATLHDEDFDGLLAAAGMSVPGAPQTGGSGLPERMAEVNSLLDLAAPALREALLVAFLDRLSRPVRRSAGRRTD